MRFKSKEEFLRISKKEWEKLQKLLETVSIDQMVLSGVWGGDRSIKDIFAHIHEWHKMCLNWYKEGLTKDKVDMPQKGYKWNETVKLNFEINKKYKMVPLEKLLIDYKNTHEVTIELIISLSDVQLLQPGYFKWCGKNPFSTYLSGSVISHYRWSYKKIKQFAKTFK